MGKTAYSGPVFGAQQLLWSAHRDNSGISTTANTIGAITVPAGVDWHVTDMHVYRGSTHSTAFVAALVDDSTTIASVALTSSLAAQSGTVRLTPESGEYDGLRVAAGSALSATVHNGGSSVTSSIVSVWVYGFPRWLQTSTRGV